jgi:hypothetical protein
MNGYFSTNWPTPTPDFKEQQLTLEQDLKSNLGVERVEFNRICCIDFYFGNVPLESSMNEDGKPVYDFPRSHVEALQQALGGDDYTFDAMISSWTSRNSYTQWRINVVIGKSSWPRLYTADEVSKIKAIYKDENVESNLSEETRSLKGRWFWQRKEVPLYEVTTPDKRYVHFDAGIRGQPHISVDFHGLENPKVAHALDAIVEHLFRRVPNA